MGDISEHFNRAEFACKCGCHLDAIHPKTVAALEQYRALVCAKLGKDTPMTPNDGCRCEAHNAAVGGAVNSQHLPKNACRAVDMPRTDRLNPQQMYELALMVPAFAQGGIILYTWGLHLDTRTNGPYRDNRQTKGGK